MEELTLGRIEERKRKRNEVREIVLNAISYDIADLYFIKTRSNLMAGLDYPAQGN